MFLHGFKMESNSEFQHISCSLFSPMAMMEVTVWTVDIMFYYYNQLITLEVSYTVVGKSALYSSHDALRSSEL